MKQCGGCGIEQAGTDGIRDIRTRREHTICKSCRRRYCRKCYWANHVEYNARKRERLKQFRARNRAFVDAFLRERGCVDCGLCDPLVMEFDHVVGKKRTNVSDLVRDAAALSVLQTEMAKCVVRCANCHRRRTALTLWRKPASPPVSGTQTVIVARDQEGFRPGTYD
jgi:hypothetical protein